MSSARVGARRVAVWLTLRYEMQCGWPGTGPLTVTFPSGMQVPSRIARTALSVNGRAPSRIGHERQRLTIALLSHPEVICDVIGPGTLRVRFSRGAGLGNPTLPGRYVLVATVAKHAFRLPFRIAAAQR